MACDQILDVRGEMESGNVTQGRKASSKSNRSRTADKREYGQVELLSKSRVGTGEVLRLAGGASDASRIGR